MIGLFTGILLFGAAMTTLAALVVAQRRLVSRLASRFQTLPRVQQALLVFAVGALAAWAGTKPEGKGEIIELSNNRIIESADGSALSLVGRDVPDAPQDGISHGVMEARSGSGGGVSDRINRIDRIETPSLRASRALARRSAIAFGDLPSETLRVSTAHVSPCEKTISAAYVTSFSNPVNPVNPVEKNNLLLVRVGTNEVFDFSAPDGATVAEKWRRRGASKDYLRLNFSNWSFPFGGESFSNLVVFAGGRVRLSRDAALCPFAANLGIVPEERWPLLDRINRIDRIDSVGEGSQSSVGRDVLGAPQDEIPSQFWHLLTPSNTLVLTWQNALLEREMANPVSFQTELFPSGNVVFRYDLARIGDEGLLTNVVVEVQGREGQEGRQGLEGPEDGEIALSRSLSSLSFKTANDLRSDAARAAFDATLGGLDPLACPVGSTNTVWEHYVYTGTTNGTFALPESTASAAVLRVAVSGTGRGELIVGNRAVPLVGQGETLAALNTEETEEGSHGEEGVGVLDRINRIDRIEKTGAVVLSALTNSNPVNPVNPVEKNAVTEFSASPRLSDLRVDAPQATNECLSNLSPPQASTSTSLILLVPRGQTVPLYLRADATLSVSFSSDDFAFGSLPDLAASRLVGRINFPNVTATTPCFHDYTARRKEVTLPVGADADANKFGLWRF